ncbi:MAG TPA: molybdopterin cofactor-binding domain-containing protein [Bryobacteraceae bacterium]|nr:molybdopterin cofactor-binding domain-containing protein [Bryobacteraceae bacterium]
MNRVELVVSRRGFLGIFSAGAFVLATEGLEADATWQPSVYLGMEPSGLVTIIAHRSEMGTGIKTSLPMVAADELDVDFKNVRVEQAIGDAKYGSQDTDGSNSIRSFYEALRIAGATARTMLERAAASQWGVPVAECRARNEQVVHVPSGKKIAYAALVTAASKQAVPKKEELTFKAPSEYRYIGKALPIVDLLDMCTGKAVYGIDAKIPGMVYASIERSPVMGGKIVSVDDSEARKVKGVLQTATIDPMKPPYGFQALGGVAVIADNTWAAMQGRKKLKVDWDLGANASFDSGAFKTALKESARKPGKVARNVGDVDAEFAKGGKIIEADYYVPLLAHTPMEPPAAVAEFKNGKVIAYASTQNPQAVQATVAAAVGIKPADVTCHVTLLGGGFGRKSKPDYVAEAAVLSQKTGKPVKVVWSREDDIHFDYFHAVAAMYMKASVDAKGRPTAWLQRSAFPPIEMMFDPKAEYGTSQMGMGWSDVPFDIPHHRAENGPAKAPVRIGWMRSVANIYHAFAVQSFVDELAAAANRDRVDYLLDLLGPSRIIDLPGDKRYPLDVARLRRVVELAAEKSGWANKKSGPGHAWGVAVHRSFLSYIAAVVEVEVDAKGKVTIPRVDIAVDAGMVVHPERVTAQFEGAAVFGTSVAMLGEVTLADGRVQQGNFNNYPVARMPEAPRMTHVHIVPSDAPPAGVGEPGVPVISPAICNAIFAATGKRVRELPVKKMKLV